MFGASSCRGMLDDDPLMLVSGVSGGSPLFVDWARTDVDRLAGDAFHCHSGAHKATFPAVRDPLNGIPARQIPT